MLYMTTTAAQTLNRKTRLKLFERFRRAVAQARRTKRCRMFGLAHQASRSVQRALYLVLRRRARSWFYQRLQR
jgi:hypothetical protein